MPADLRDAPSGPVFDALPFTSLYLIEDEWAAEIVNRTVHAVMHLGWVPDQAGGYRGQMAVWVKRNGLLGTGYMAAIAPFRHLIVYPPMLRDVERDWRSHGGGTAPLPGAQDSGPDALKLLPPAPGAVTAESTAPHEAGQGAERRANPCEARTRRSIVSSSASSRGA